MCNDELRARRLLTTREEEWAGGTDNTPGVGAEVAHL